MDFVCELTNFTAFLLDATVIMTAVSLLTAVHAGLALLQGYLWKSERIWQSRKIFVLSLIYFPIGFLGFRAWNLYKLKKSVLELSVFVFLLVIFLYLFWDFGFSNQGGDRWGTLQYTLGMEDPECLSLTWPFSTSIWFISYLCNLLVFHHLAWPFFEGAFWLIKKVRSPKTIV